MGLEMCLLFIFAIITFYLNYMYKNDTILLAIAEFFVILIAIKALIVFPEYAYFIIAVLFITVILSIQNMIYNRIKD